MRDMWLIPVRQFFRVNMDLQEGFLRRSGHEMITTGNSHFLYSILSINFIIARGRGESETLTISMKSIYPPIDFAFRCLSLSQ